MGEMIGHYGFVGCSVCFICQLRNNPTTAAHWVQPQLNIPKHVKSSSRNIVGKYVVGLAIRRIIWISFCVCFLQSIASFCSLSFSVPLVQLVHIFFSPFVYGNNYYSSIWTAPFSEKKDDKRVCRKSSVESITILNCFECVYICIGMCVVCARYEITTKSIIIFVGIPVNM